MPHASIEAIHGAVVGTTAPQMFLQLVGEHPDLPALHAMRSEAPGSWHVWTLRDYATTSPRPPPGLQLAGARAERADPADAAQPSRVPLVRPRRSVPASNAGQHLQLVVSGGGRLPRRACRGADRHRRGCRIPRPAAERPPTNCRCSNRSTSSTRPPGGCPAGVLPASVLMDSGCGRPTGAGRRHPARRPRHADLHQRHDRPAQGRDDQSLQRRVHRRVVAPVLRARHVRSVAVSSATCRWRTSPSG